jgi:hypothetical protein
VLVNTVLVNTVLVNTVLVNTRTGLARPADVHRVEGQVGSDDGI